MTARRVALVVTISLFTAAIIFSLGGMSILRFAPSAANGALRWLPLLMHAPTWVYIVTLPLAVLLIFWPMLGARDSLLFAAWGMLVGAAAELAGTSTGIPFGPYSYTDFLGPKILAHVPWAIPPSWYAASLLCFALASAAGRRGVSRVVLAGLFMVCWDVALDPAMSAAVPIWRWGTPGIYYGMPWVNWVGWFVTSLVICGGYEWLRRGAMFAMAPMARRLWLINGAFAVGMVAVNEMWLAVVVGAVALLLPVILPAMYVPRTTGERLGAA